MPNYIIVIYQHVWADYHFLMMTMMTQFCVFKISPSFVIEGRTTIRIGLYFNLISVQVRSGRRSKVNKDFIFGDMKVPGIAVILRLTLEQHIFIANQLQLPPGYWDGG